jgi:hypothetical protein
MNQAFNYQYVLFLGDDDGNVDPNGKTWWAANKEFDSIGDGTTPTEAIDCCAEFINVKIEIYKETNRPIPIAKHLMKIG